MIATRIAAIFLNLVPYIMLIWVIIFAPVWVPYRIYERIRDGY